MADQETFSWSKWFAGLWGLVNYAKVASTAVKAAIIIVAVLVGINTINSILPKKQPTQSQTQTIDAKPAAGGATKITNVVNNNPPPKSNIIGMWGGTDKDRDWRINVGYGRMF